MSRLVGATSGAEGRPARVWFHGWCPPGSGIPSSRPRWGPSHRGPCPSSTPVPSGTAGWGPDEQQIAVLGEENGSQQRRVAGSAEAGFAWSPTPIAAYRMWRLHRGGLHGARSVWRQPELEAGCARRPRSGADGVHHHDGCCGRLGCGIYATKDLAGLLGGMVARMLPGSGVVVGLVPLSGKVVEHERGYRAARARAVAVASVSGGGLVTADDPEWIAALFARPEEVLQVGGGPAPAIMVSGWHRWAAFSLLVAEYLGEQAGRFKEAWTSGNRSE